MKPIRFYTLPRATIERLTSAKPIPHQWMSDWLSVRQGILDDDKADVFCQNSRSATQRWAQFDLFEQVADPCSTGAIVVMSWLELFEAAGVRESIGIIIDYLKTMTRYPRNPVVLSWNHDRDAATVPEFADLPDNFVVLNYNTSLLRSTDLAVPFWNVDTSVEWDSGESKRMVRGSYVGYVGRVECRRRMLYAFRDKPGWEVSDSRVPKDEYLGLMCCSDFALCPRGGGLSSYRFYEAIQCGAIPILFSDSAVLPYPDLCYSDFCIHLTEAMAGDFDAVQRLTDQADVDKMRRKLADVRQRFSLAGVQEAIYERLQEMTA